jgi:hypothetical protein
MPEFLREPILVAFALLCVALGLASLRSPRTRRGFLIVGGGTLAYIVADAFLFVRTGNRLDDYVACYPVKDSMPVCRRLYGKDPERAPERRTAVRDWTRSAPDPPSVSRPPDGPFDGWWEAGKPTAPEAVLGDPEKLWRWASSQRGSCQPMRDYRGAYPAGAHAAEAGLVLERLSRRTIEIPAYASVAKNTARRRVTSRQSSIKNMPRICDAIGDASVLEIYATCKIQAFVDEVGGKAPTYLTSYYRKIPNSCACVKSPYEETYDCSISVEPVCIMRYERNLAIEQCV